MSGTTLLLLVLLGIAVGAVGTLVGAGGGFILTPVLAILYPQDPPAVITAISLAVVFCNATAGSLAYARQRRIDYRSGALFAVATLPGAIAGALLLSVVHARLFDLLLAVALGVLAVWLITGDGKPRVFERSGAGVRTIVDRYGERYRYAPRTRLGVVVSVAVGFVSSFLGIGGGVVHVPLMVRALGFPTHIATATSHFVLANMSAVATVTHAIAGAFGGRDVILRVAALGVGAIVGAQAGAHLSRRVHGRVIQRVLALALVGVAVRLAVGVL